MIRLEDGKLHLNDGTFYDLEKSGLRRVLKGLKFQLQDREITHSEYKECIELILK
jgi:hypothetical protein